MLTLFATESPKQWTCLTSGPPDAPVVIGQSTILACQTAMILAIVLRETFSVVLHASEFQGGSYRGHRAEHPWNPLRARR